MTLPRYDVLIKALVRKDRFGVLKRLKRFPRWRRRCGWLAQQKGDVDTSTLVLLTWANM